MILVACAVRRELRDWDPPGGVDLLVTGVGAVDAAVAVSATLATERYTAVINAGLAGAFAGRGTIGEAVLVAEERLADFGLEGGDVPVLPDDVRLCGRVAASDALLARIAGLPYRVVNGVTVSLVTTTEATAERLVRRYDADIESMEGFAVLRACECARVPALEIRGVSNRVGPRERSGWDFAAGSSACIAALNGVLHTLGTVDGSRHPVVP